MNITFKFTGIEKALEAMDKVKEDLEKNVDEVLAGGGQLIRGEAVRSIQQGSKTGRIYQKYNPRRTHRASAPGEAPASDTGFLASSIMVKKEKDVVQVTSNAKYAPFLEFGTSKILPRPFMFPASEKSKPKIAEAIFQREKRVVSEFSK